MRTRTGSAFLNVLALQRRRMQQGFQSSPDVGPMERTDIGADIGDLTLLSEGSRGADIASARRLTSLRSKGP